MGVGHSDAATSMFPVQGNKPPRSEEVLAVREAAAQTTCAHQYRQFKESITPERTPKQELNGYGYKQGRAYFIVLGCILCHDKRNINMRVEHG